MPCARLKKLPGTGSGRWLTLSSAITSWMGFILNPPIREDATVRGAPDMETPRYHCELNRRTAQYIRDVLSGETDRR